MDEHVEAKIAVIESMVKQLHTRLLGNGQKGVIQIHDEMLGGITAWKNKATGALGMISFFVAALGFTKVAELLGWIK